MDSKSEKDKLRALNLIGQNLELQIGTHKLEGEVFYFNEKVLILKKGKEYIFTNINKYEELQINCHLNAKRTDKLKEELSNESVKPSDVLSYILE